MTGIVDMPGWRDVPMPPAIRALPRTPNGIPIPYITEWSSGADSYRTDPILGPIFDCTCVSGRGQPQLGVNCTSAQMRAWAKRLCSTCGKPIRRNDDCWWFSVDDNPMFGEPPNHADCLAYSIQVCPHLRGKLLHDTEAEIVRARNFHLWPVRDPDPSDPDTQLALVTPRTPASVHKHHGVLIGYRARPINEHRTPARDWLHHRLDKYTK